MKLLRLNLLVLFLLVVLVIGCIEGGEPEKNVKFSITDISTFEPLIGGTVTVYDSEDNFVGDGEVDEDGNVSFALPPGNYTMVISVPGYEERSRNITVPESGKELVEIRMTEEGPCEEDWSCTTWSECANGSQNRTCVDSNSCNVTEYKPPEIQNCTEVPPPECANDDDCDDDDDCTKDECTVNFSCVNTDITSCVNDDDCCPTDCVYENDTDCPILQPDCNINSDCDDSDDCTENMCVYGECIYPEIFDCIDDDGCCPDECDDTDDDDCSEEVECSHDDDCDDDDDCTEDDCVDDVCVNEEITTCKNNDDCCPDDCEPYEDDDCNCDNDNDCDDDNECTDDDCGSDDKCDNDDVDDDTVCGTGGICCSGECVTAACSVNSDCGTNTSCMNYTCSGAETCGAECGSTTLPDNTSCGSGQVCCDGECIQPACVFQDDCDISPYLCIFEYCLYNGTCAAECGYTPMDAFCEDQNECTIDTCSLADNCTYTFVDNGTSCISGVCCAGDCVTAVCEFDLDCDDLDNCTVDVCVDGCYCDHLAITECYDGDFCCPPGCNFSNDYDCPPP